MKILYYDCFSGISGDMNLGALIDLGVNEDHLMNELKKLKLNDEFSLEIGKGNKMGIYGVRVNVNCRQHKHSHHEHNHGHNHGHSHHRNFTDIQKIINNSDLSDYVKSLSIKIFERIAIAEAKIHYKSVNEIHFHEVGATDSIVDIVGAAICLDALNIDKVYSSSIELGGGFVNCAHGTFPVPAPATSEILKNIPVKKGAVNEEAATPTGAAILAETVTEFTDKPEMKILKTGYGIGYKDFSIPNVLRAHLAELIEPNTNTEYDIQKMTECNIDDMNPEMYDYVFELLFSAGAKDVFLTPITMKKSRPAIKLSVLHSAENSENIKNIILQNTSTLGTRSYSVEKNMLERRTDVIESKWGKIPVKISYVDDKIFNIKPEYEACKSIAKANNISLKLIYKETDKLIAEKYK